MSAAAEFPAFPRADAGALVRWPACLALVLALHAAAVLALLRRADRAEPFAPPPEAVLIDLAPAPEAPAAEPEPEPAEAPPPPPQPVAEAPPEPPPPEPAEQVAEIPPEPPPPEPPPREPPPPSEPTPPAVPEAVLPQPPPPPPPPPRPAARPQAQPRPAPEDRRAVAEARQAAEAPPAPAVAQPPPPPSNAVPTWQGQLLGRLQRFKRYPEAARSRREEGVVHLTFSMDREGRVLAANVAKGSGFPELDAETLALVRRAEPLPPPPPEMRGDPLTLTVPVRFSLR